MTEPHPVTCANANRGSTDASQYVHAKMPVKAPARVTHLALASCVTRTSVCEDCAHLQTECAGASFSCFVVPEWQLARVGSEEPEKALSPRDTAC